MHVGHIRSTGIGDALQRTLRLLGHRVITDNHIGDWGTQFGKLLVGWKQILESRRARSAMPSPNWNGLYKFINAAVRCESRACSKKPRPELVKLQAGDAENISIWKEMIRLSQIQFDTIYARLGVKFDFALGESFYNPWLGEVVDDLLEVRHRAGKRRRRGRVQRRFIAAEGRSVSRQPRRRMDRRSRARAQERRRIQLHDHRSCDDGLPAENLVAE